MSAPNNLSGADTDPVIDCGVCRAKDVLYNGHERTCTVTVAESFARWEQRINQVGDCPSEYPDGCPDVDACAVHDDGSLFRTRKNADKTEGK